jgi:CheY-like chemotaxis protein
VKCAFDLSDELWPVEIDEGQMSQVFNNLIINARQAMPNGGEIIIDAENVMIGADSPLHLQRGRYILISIRDKGYGIPEEILPKIFDPYFTTKDKGSGLGLTTAYSIVRNHEGHIAVESAVGSGTLFHIHLPASEKRQLAKSIPEEGPKPERGAGRVLVMDDEEIVREVAKEILVHLGYRADLCGNGTEAVKLHGEAMNSEDPYAVVIMDLTVPDGMGGKETIKKLLEIDASVKGIVSSGYSEDPILAHYAEYGFSGVVSKPYLANELHEALQSLM